MLHTAKTSPNKRPIDQFGNLIPNVESFDDKTNEVTLLLVNSDGAAVKIQNEKGEVELFRVKVVIPGAKLLDMEEEDEKSKKS